MNWGTIMKPKMTQGETVEELEDNIKDAYLLMAMDDVPEEHQVIDKHSQGRRKWHSATFKI